jgi:hypothetical protein
MVDAMTESLISDSLASDLSPEWMLKVLFCCLLKTESDLVESRVLLYDYVDSLNLSAFFITIFCCACTKFVNFEELLRAILAGSTPDCFSTVIDLRCDAFVLGLDLPPTLGRRLA